MAQLGRERLPGYIPDGNPAGQFWKARRRVTHNRLFDKLAALECSPRSRLSYFQTMRGRVRSPVDRQPKKRTASAGS